MISKLQLRNLVADEDTSTAEGAGCFWVPDFVVVGKAKLLCLIADEFEDENRAVSKKFNRVILGPIVSARVVDDATVEIMVEDTMEIRWSRLLMKRYDLDYCMLANPQLSTSSVKMGFLPANFPWGESEPAALSCEEIVSGIYRVLAYMQRNDMILCNTRECDFVIQQSTTPSMKVTKDMVFSKRPFLRDRIVDLIRIANSTSKSTPQKINLKRDRPSEANARPEPSGTTVDTATGPSSPPKKKRATKKLTQAERANQEQKDYEKQQKQLERSEKKQQKEREKEDKKERREQQKNKSASEKKREKEEEEDRIACEKAERLTREHTVWYMFGCERTFEIKVELIGRPTPCYGCRERNMTHVENIVKSMIRNPTGVPQIADVIPWDNDKRKPVDLGKMEPEDFEAMIPNLLFVAVSGQHSTYAARLIRSRTTTNLKTLQDHLRFRRCRVLSGATPPAVCIVLSEAGNDANKLGTYESPAIDRVEHARLQHKDCGAPPMKYYTPKSQAFLVLSSPYSLCKTICKMLIYVVFFCSTLLSALQDFLLDEQ